MVMKAAFSGDVAAFALESDFRSCESFQSHSDISLMVTFVIELIRSSIVMNAKEFSLREIIGILNFLIIATKHPRDGNIFDSVLVLRVSLCCAHNRALMIEHIRAMDYWRRHYVILPPKKLSALATA